MGVCVQSTRFLAFDLQIVFNLHAAFGRNAFRSFLYMFATMLRLA